MAIYVDRDTGMLLVASTPQHGTGLLAAAIECCCVAVSSGVPDDNIDGCCDLNNNLSSTITDKTGIASLMPDSVPFTQGSGLTWLSSTFASPCPADGASAGMTLSCSGETWSLSGSTFVGFSFTAVEVDCSAQRLIFDVTITTSCGGGTFRIVIQG